MMLSRQLFELLVTGLLLLLGLEVEVGLECLLGLGGRVIVSGYFMHLVFLIRFMLRVVS